MKKILLVLIVFAICFCALEVSACETVAPAAWITLKTDGGKVYYSTDMYGNNGAHIYYYENETDENAVIEIRFSPRILGPETVDGTKTTLVDVAGTYAMYITVHKENDTYSADKAFYLNGAETPLVPERTDDATYFVSFEFYDFGLIRGNPNGKINGVINTLEYK
ncbi:MAG: hypothetical protein IJU83_04695 [Clostridia bacterium]|nr:hypothetical protein [Clostridia bacterium]